MKILVTGATGLIGRRFIERAGRRATPIIALSRDAARGRRTLGDGGRGPRVAGPEGARRRPPRRCAAPTPSSTCSARRSPSAGRDATKQEIRDSRVRSTDQLVAGLRELPEAERPRVLVSQSATGYYGARGRHAARRARRRRATTSSPAWSRSGRPQADRRARARPAGGAGPHRGRARRGRRRAGQDAPAVQGSGSAARWPAASSGCRGSTSTTSSARCCAWSTDDAGRRARPTSPRPHPATNAELSKALGRALHRPAVLPVPGLRAEAALRRDGDHRPHRRRVVPTRLEELGYEFAHPGARAGAARRPDRDPRHRARAARRRASCPRCSTSSPARATSRRSPRRGSRSRC